MAKKPASKTVEILKHAEATRRNIPTAELESVVSESDKAPIAIAYERRNRDLDPQLVWRGKDEQDWSDLVVTAPPLYIQEKVHPKVLIDDLLRASKSTQPRPDGEQLDLFADFNGIPEGADKTEFYQHEQNWSNRMILGDSLQVMASLAEREGLRGQVQCIYFDPPYGIKFNSNFQWSTTSRDVRDGKSDHITREPEQVRAFRDTWRDGIHSYLTYLRDRLTVARDLLSDSGSIFVQIGDENVHRVRAALDEVFGEDNFVQTIVVKKKSTSVITEPINDFVLWVAKRRDAMKIRILTQEKDLTSEKSRFTKVELADLTRIDVEIAKADQLSAIGTRLLNDDYPMVSQDPQEGRIGPYTINGQDKFPGKNRHWTLDPRVGMRRVERSNRLRPTSGTVRGVVYVGDFGQEPLSNIWEFHGESDPVYVVQTNRGIVQRCLLMTTDPGDLVLDPTCGSGTTAAVAEQWGRRWMTIDTSRVALALARARIMGARYPFYLLADSRDGQVKEAEVTHSVPSSQPVHGSIRQGFVCHRVPHITLKSIANNAEIDVIWDQWQTPLETLRQSLNTVLKRAWQAWEVPREADSAWPEDGLKLHTAWWQGRISRQKEIDASIAAKAEFEYLYDRPYQDNKIVRVAGPFTVESLSPHRVLGVDEDDELIDAAREGDAEYGARQTFSQMILENLRTAGVQQAHKEDRISFTSLMPWAGDLVSADGRYFEGETEKRAAIFIGPEFGTVQRVDLVDAAREAGDAAFDVLIACAFNYDAHATEFSKLGRIPVLKARMNADLHMAEDLKNTGKGNLFVIFGEPDITLMTEAEGRLRVKVNGVDVFKPQTGEVVSGGPEDIACWFIDTDYNGESFFVRHAYFLGANDPYSALKTTLKTEINADAWETLHSDTSRPFDKPATGRIAVKVINHLGDEVMKVFRV
jgi:adenine-specific DNA-methyltransferase